MKLYINGALVKTGAHNITNWTPTGGNVNFPLAIGTLYPYGDPWAGNA